MFWLWLWKKIWFCKLSCFIHGGYKRGFILFGDTAVSHLKYQGVCGITNLTQKQLGFATTITIKPDTLPAIHSWGTFSFFSFFRFPLLSLSTLALSPSHQIHLILCTCFPHLTENEFSNASFLSALSIQSSVRSHGNLRNYWRNRETPPISVFRKHNLYRENICVMLASTRKPDTNQAISLETQTSFTCLSVQ